MAGAHSFRGRPGKPAPEPMSSTVGRTLLSDKPLPGSPASGGSGCVRCVSDWGGCVGSLDHADKSVRATLFSGNKWRVRKKDSAKWRVTISSGSRMAVRLMRAFQRSNRSMYIDICWSCTAGSVLSTKGWSRVAMRAVSIGGGILQRGDGGSKSSFGTQVVGRILIGGDLGGGSQGTARERSATRYLKDDEQEHHSQDCDRGRGFLKGRPVHVDISDSPEGACAHFQGRGPETLHA